MSKKMRTGLKKSVSMIVAVTTIVWLSGLAILLTPAITIVADERPSVVVEGVTVYDGDLISSNAVNPDSTPTYASLDIYIAKVVSATETYKRLVLNPQVFDSYGHLNWGDVAEVDQTVMDAFSTSCLTREDGDTKVYAMAPDDDTGTKSWVNLTETEFVGATTGTYSANTAGAIYTINSTDAGNYTATGDLTAVSAFETYLSDGTLPDPPAGGALTVALSSSTPVSRAVIGGATPESQVDLAHFIFTGNATVNSITLKRIGISADASFANVFLFDGSTRITDGSSVSSGSLITFNDTSGLFAVNGSKTISVKADMSTTSVAGETVGVQLVSAVSGSINSSGTPISGNTFSVAVATLAGVALSAPTTPGNNDPANDITVFQGTATVGTRDVLMTRLALRQTGSISSSDINTFTLYVDGVPIDTVDSLDSNGYVTFDVSQALKTGARILKVTANIIGGSSRTVQFTLRGAYDISMTDTQYNAGVTATLSATPFGATSTFTVNSGSMTVVKSTASQSTNLTVGASDQSLATYTFTAFGEPIKVETLKVGILGTTSGTIANVTLQNVKIMVDGGQVGSNTPVPAANSFGANTGTQFTTNFTVTPGTPATVEIRGDMIDTNTTAGDDISLGIMTAAQAVLVGGTGSNNGTPQVSITAVNVPVDTNVLGNSLTIASGSMSVAQTSNYGTQTVVVPHTAFKIGSYVLTGNATEAVNLNTLYVGFTSGSSATEEDDLSSLYVIYGSTTTTPKGTVSATIENGNSWSINKTLAVNESITFDVYSTIGTSLGSGETVISTLAVAGTTAQSGIAVYADSSVPSDTTLDAGFTGQTITEGTGTIAASADASAPVSALVDDSGTVTTAAFKFAATNDSYTITNLTVTITDPSSVSTVNLMDGITPVVGGSKAANASVVYSGLNIAVPANQSKVITVQLVMSSVGSGAGLTGGALLTTLTAATAKNSGGTNSTPSGLPAAGNAMYVYKALPIITNVALPTTLLVGNGNIVTLAKFKVSSSGGAIAWAKLLATVSVSISEADDVFTSPTLWDLTSGSAVQVEADGSFITDLSNASGSITVIPNVEQQISGSKTYELRATLAGTITANDVVTTQITQPSVFADSLTAFAMGTTATTLAYYDKGNTDAVAVGDVRKTAVNNYSAAGDTTSNVRVMTYVETKFDNTADTEGTIILTYTHSGTTWADAGTGTATGWSSVTGDASSVTLTNDSGAIIVGTPASDMTDDADLIIAISLGTAFGTNSTVGSGESDIGVALTPGVAVAASFVWSDVSANSHGITTADWTNGFLVTGLPNSTQNLLK